MYPLNPRICFVCSHGGHLNEMLDLVPVFEQNAKCFISYDSPTTRMLPEPHCLVPNRPRNPFAHLLNCVRFYFFFRKHAPHMIVSTGAEIALAAVLVGKYLFKMRIVYIECGAQVETPSGTGRLMAYLADALYVQWPELLPAYRGGARYAGSLIADDPPQ